MQFDTIFKLIVISVLMVASLLFWWRRKAKLREVSREGCLHEVKCRVIRGDMAVDVSVLRGGGVATDILLFKEHMTMVSGERPFLSDIFYKDIVEMKFVRKFGMVLLRMELASQPRTEAIYLQVGELDQSVLEEFFAGRISKKV